VLVVGGRSFTSAILQKNCHEFIAYENLIAPQGGPQRRPTEKARVSSAPDPNLEKAFPLVRRALKVLTDREVSPQLGLLKSTLLQLDSTFSERNYGASTFRDFIEKMAAKGYVTLKQVDRSLLVEAKEQLQGEGEEAEQAAAVPAAPAPSNGQAESIYAPPAVSSPAASSPAVPSPVQAEEGVRAMQEAFQNSKITPHWPMYLRNVKQFIKNSSPTFDEQRYGFHNFLEAVRSGQRAGLFRLERNRQGILRVFPGNQMPSVQRADSRAIVKPAIKPYDVEDDLIAPPVAEPESTASPAMDEESATEAQPEAEAESTASEQSNAVEDLEKPARKRRASFGIKRKTVAPRKAPVAAGAKRPRKKASPPSEGELPS
jgi:hypothetical protein